MAKPLPPILPWIGPFVLFVGLLGVESNLPDQHYVFYPVKALLVAAVIAWYWFRGAYPPLAPSAALLSTLVGVLGVVLWICLDPWALRLDAFVEALYNRAVSLVGLASYQTDLTPLHPIGRNPFALYSPAIAWLLFAVRLAGISLVVPVMEELFWRGFLMRWLVKDHFTDIELGTYTPGPFWITTAVFALVHGSEWPMGVAVGIVYGFWFVRQKSLGDVMVAHGVTNFLLALYCLFSGDWHFLSTVAPPSHAGR